MKENSRCYALKISDYKRAGSVFKSAREYYLITCCFNVVHEIGHVLFNSYHRLEETYEDDTSGRLFEEKLVIDFAAAFWKAFGSEIFIDDVQRIYTEILDNTIGELEKYSMDDNDDISKLLRSINTERLTWFDNNAYERFGRLDFGVNVSQRYLKKTIYNMFQSLYNIKSLNNHRPFVDVLTELTGIKVPSEVEMPQREYSYDIHTPVNVINDVIDILNQYEVELPPISYMISEEDGVNSVEVLR